MKTVIVEDNTHKTQFEFHNGGESFVSSFFSKTGEQCGERFKQDSKISRKVIDIARKDPQAKVYQAKASLLLTSN